jgi:hypothetical protein
MTPYTIIQHEGKITWNGKELDPSASIAVLNELQRQFSIEKPKRDLMKRLANDHPYTVELDGTLEVYEDCGCYSLHGPSSECSLAGKDKPYKCVKKIQLVRFVPAEKDACEFCNGTGKRNVTIHSDNGDMDADDQPCSFCDGTGKEENSFAPDLAERMAYECLAPFCYSGYLDNERTSSDLVNMVVRLMKDYRSSFKDTPTVTSDGTTPTGANSVTSEGTTVKEDKKIGLSDKYYLLCYYVHSYLESVKQHLAYDSKTTVESFMESRVNGKYCNLVHECALAQFHYELSYNQICNGVDLFLKSVTPEPPQESRTINGEQIHMTIIEHFNSAGQSIQKNVINFPQE